MPKKDDFNNNFQTKPSESSPPKQVTHTKRDNKKNKQNPSLRQEQRFIRAGGDGFCGLPFNTIEKNQRQFGYGGTTQVLESLLFMESVNGEHL